MAESWLLLFLVLGCPTLPTGMGSTPFPSLAPPITLLVDGKQQTLVVCLVLDIAPPGFESPIWFSAGNGSSLDAFTYGPSPAEDGTWTRLAQLSLHSEELAAWDTLVCHTGPGAGDHSQSTQPLRLSGDASSARTCLWEPLRGTRALALRLGALRMLLFKLLLLDVLLTCSRLRAPAAARQDPAGASGPGARGLPAPSGVPQADSRLLSQPPPPQGSSAGPADRIRRSHGGTRGRGLSVSASPALEPGTAAASGFAPAVRVGIPGTQSGRRGRRFSGPGARDPPSVFPAQALEHFSILCLLQRTRASPGASLRQTEVLSELKNLCLSH